MRGKTAPSLDASAIRRGVARRLKKYEKRNVLEQFALFMGMAQILELGLKRLLVERYEYDAEEIARWTMGKTTVELKKSGLRLDFVALLESLVRYRNHIAHELLANEMMLRTLLRGYSGRHEVRELEKGIYELEQIAFLYDWCERHDAWA